jgi:putative flavoprotein involved in K+ transport
VKPDAALNVVVIGGGHAGLAMSYCLAERGIAHTVFEQGRIGESWRSKRWDSFTLVTPNRLIRLPGFGYRGDRPDQFFSRDEYVDYLERYARSFDAPVRCGVRITTLERDSARSGYVLTSDRGVMHARSVVVATGGCHRPRRPAFSGDLPQGIHQLDPENYRNPDDLPEGAVLVVGSGQSGAQIAEELQEHGRTVYLSVGSSGRWPRRYRGKDINVWLAEIDERTVDTLDSPAPRVDRNPHLSGRDGGHEIDLRELGHQGAVLLGRVGGVHGGRLRLCDDLEENLAKADERVVAVKKTIDEFIEKRGHDAPPEPQASVSIARGGTPPAPVAELDLRSAGISTVIWATGYVLDFGWIKIPVFDAEGFPLHHRGISVQPGLYFVGLPWQYRATSSGVIGVGDDAAFIAQHIAARRG